MSPPSVSTVTLSTSVWMVIFSDAAAAGLAATAGAWPAAVAVAAGTPPPEAGAAGADEDTALGAGLNIEGCPLCFCQPSQSRTRDIVNTTHSTVRRISVMGR